MQPAESVRVLMYSHDTYGLGHLTRTLRIAGALRARHPAVSVLILSGSSVAPYFRLPPGTDLIKLPSVVKSGPDEYRSRDLEVDFRQIRSIRRELIQSAAKAYRPHLLMVDNVPLGMKGEIRSTLELMSSQVRPAPHIILNLRDILDEPARIRSAWRRDGVYEVLDEIYDRIFVLGDPSVHDATAAYELPCDKVFHAGYATPAPRLIRPRRTARRRPHILVTAGGGGDGADFVEAVLRAIHRLGDGHPTGTHPRLTVVTGPLMEARDRGEIVARAAPLRAEVHEYVADLPARMEHVDLVIGMAGYNTCCEILAHARAALLFPRRTPRLEQWLRAQALAERRLVSVLGPDDLSPDAVAAQISLALSDGPRIRPEALPLTGGLERLTERLGQDYPELFGPRRRPGTATTPLRAPDSRPAGIEAGHCSLHARGGAWYWPGPAPGAVRTVLLAAGILLGSIATAAVSPSYADERGGEDPSPWRPAAAGGTVSVGWHDNILGSSTAEEAGFESGDPDYLFVVDRLDDWRLDLGLWGRWEIPSFYRKARVELGYRRAEWKSGDILGRDRYVLELRQRLPGRSQIDGSLSYEPQVYQRHRVDKDALPGEPRFRPEALEVTELELGYTRFLSSVRATLFGGHGTENRTKWFRERDEEVWRGGLSLTPPPLRSVVFSSHYEYARGHSRNEPDLGSDRSFRQQAVGIGLASEPRWGRLALQLRADGRVKFRAYTTRDPEDESRFDRDDLIFYWSAKVGTAAGRLRPFVAAEGTQRSVNLPSEADASDEDGEYQSNLIRFGLDWEY